MYTKLAGMTGTAETEATEFYSIYKLDVAVIPTNQPVVRDDLADKIFINERAKLNAIAKDVEEMHRRGQPVLLGTISVEKSEEISKLLKRRNVRHNVLNAKYHEREAEIIQHAGELGAVTIATNMAGRGTDIKLGEGVKEVGGLFVIGSERHEARRIDNQLRGRSGRQGDPGASQFYVSLTDDLMRLFGMDGRVDTMQRMGFTEDDVIQNKFISNAIEKAQKRVEERNFEIRKNLLEYDNVMNEQRTYIYGLRDKILDISHNASVIDELVYDVINDFTDGVARQTGKTFSWEDGEINGWLMAKFGTHSSANLAHMSHEEAVEEVFKLIKDVTGAAWEAFQTR
jgi:preprotein translocase subunit SecA